MTTDKNELREMVRDCLNNAYFENGYKEQATDSPKSVAIELQMYADYYFAEIELELIIPFVKEWQDEIKCTLT